MKAMNTFANILEDTPWLAIAIVILLIPILWNALLSAPAFDTKPEIKVGQQESSAIYQALCHPPRSLSLWSFGAHQEGVLRGHQTRDKG